jgi:hypothetical protein
MNYKALVLVAVAMGAVQSLGCSNETTTTNAGWNHGSNSVDPNSLAADGNTQHHFQDPNTGENGISDPNVIHADDAQVGSPEVVARLHACGKIPYASLGSILSTRGVNMAAGAKAGTAAAIYQTGASALGVASYAGRVPEALIASTSAMSKEFDILLAAAPEIQTNLTKSTACPGVTIADATGIFSKDGISCLLGKPATDGHVTLANQLVTQAPDVATGVKLAISALLEAAHTCE